jgi:hypothetical protein
MSPVPSCVIWGATWTTREEIARLVRYHGRPAFLLERDEPTHEVVRLSWLVSNRLLYLFALADTRGRDTDSMSRPEENLHFWKLMAEEAGCYDQPYPFATDHARFTFFRQREPNLHYVPHEDFSCEVTVMSGLPGSGKDRWLGQNRSELPVVSLDDIRGELGVEPTDDQGQVAQLPENAAGSFCDPERRSPSTPRTRCGRPVVAGSICSPITTPASRSSTSNRRSRTAA